MSKEKICGYSKKGTLELLTFNGKSKPVDWIKDAKIEGIFPASVGKVIVKSTDAVYLYDLSGRKIVAEQSITNMRRVYWSSNNQYVALCSNS